MKREERREKRWMLDIRVEDGQDHRRVAEVFVCRVVDFSISYAPYFKLYYFDVRKDAGLLD